MNMLNFSLTYTKTDIRILFKIQTTLTAPSYIFQFPSRTFSTSTVCTVCIYYLLLLYS